MGQLEKKKCSCCKQHLPISEFSKRIDTPDGLQYTCKPCSNRRVKKAKKRGDGRMRYDDVIRMLEEQDFKCALCTRPLSMSDAHVDHCHEFGHVRGIIHSSCNLLLGKAGENKLEFESFIQMFYLAAEYLINNRYGRTAPNGSGRNEVPDMWQAGEESV